MEAYWLDNKNEITKPLGKFIALWMIILSEIMSVSFLLFVGFGFGFSYVYFEWNTYKGQEINKGHGEGRVFKGEKIQLRSIKG